MGHYKANVLTNPITVTAQEYPALLCGQNSKTWTKYFANDLGRIAQVVGTRMTTGNNTIFLINNNRVPKDKKVTYGGVVDSIKTHK